jgi:hypothetical protein
MPKCVVNFISLYLYLCPSLSEHVHLCIHRNICMYIYCLLTYIHTYIHISVHKCGRISPVASTGVTPFGAGKCTAGLPACAPSLVCPRAHLKCHIELSRVHHRGKKHLRMLKVTKLVFCSRARCHPSGMQSAMRLNACARRETPDLQSSRRANMLY